MADVKDPISGLAALTQPLATGDLLVYVDVSDPSQAGTGTTKHMTVANLFTAPALASPTVTGLLTFPTGAAFVNTPGSLQRTPVAGVVVQGITGSTGDFTLVSAAGANVLANPTGTIDLVAFGKLSVADVLSGTSAILSGDVVVANTQAFRIKNAGGTGTAIATMTAGNRIDVGDFTGSYAVRLGGTSVTLVGPTSVTGTMTASGFGAFSYLAGPIGVGGVAGTSMAFDIQSTTGALMVPRMTTTQKNALAAANGMIVFDTTLVLFQAYEAGAWRAFGST